MHTAARPTPVNGGLFATSYTPTPHSGSPMNMFPRINSPAPRLAPHHSIHSGAKRLTTSSGVVGQAVASPVKNSKSRQLGGSADLEAAEKVVQDMVYIDNNEINSSWKEVCGLSEAKRALVEMVILPTLNPEIFSGIRGPPKGILLFGPPGNGKTFLARACAAEAGANFYYLTPSVLNSKYHGESEKMCRAVFSHAQKMSKANNRPSVIFMDEVDAILSSRSSEGEHEVSRRIKTEMLQTIDGLLTKEGSQIFVLAATNRPQDLDNAVLRRLEKRIHIPLPDQEQRKHIFRKLLRDVGDQELHITEQDMSRILSRTNDYAASDLKIIAREASLLPFRDYSLEDVATMSLKEMPAIEASHFDKAIDGTQSSVDPEEVKQLLVWNSKFGSS